MLGTASPYGTRVRTVQPRSRSQSLCPPLSWSSTLCEPSRLPPPPPSVSVGQAPQHAVQVVDGASAGTGAHVRSLAEGLVARGLRVTVCAPPGAEATYGFHRRRG